MIKISFWNFCLKEQLSRGDILARRNTNPSLNSKLNNILNKKSETNKIIKKIKPMNKNHPCFIHNKWVKLYILDIFVSGPLVTLSALLNGIA